MEITKDKLQENGFSESEYGDYLIKEFPDGAEVRVYEGCQKTIEIINGLEMSRVVTNSLERMITMCSLHHISIWK